MKSDFKTLMHVIFYACRLKMILSCVQAGVKLGDVEFSSVGVSVAAGIRVDVDLQLDSIRFHSAVNKRRSLSRYFPVFERERNMSYGNYNGS